jgi:hypothetical protein
MVSMLRDVHIKLRSDEHLLLEEALDQFLSLLRGDQTLEDARKVFYPREIDILNWLLTVYHEREVR